MASALSAQAPPGVPEESRGAWLALLHYWNADGEWLSDVEDPAFFLHPEGRRSPDREWEAEYRAFRAPADPGDLDGHAQCRFPARFALMKQALGWSDQQAASVRCPGFEAHEGRLSAKSISVVFVSHYLANPSSAFGHVMLYLGSGSERTSALADYSVSFEADTEGMTPREYLPRGLTGGLVAGYRLMPLHERVRKYEREEQRGLWLFELRVGKDQIDQLVRHLWELRDVTYRYGFFGGNCAQKILGVVHAVFPEYALLPYRTLAVLPSEASKRLVERIGLAGEPSERPSLWRQFDRQVSGLDPKEREDLDQMLASRTVIDGASAGTLTAALLWSEIETPYRAFRRASDNDDHPDLVWRRAVWSSLAAKTDTGASAPATSVQPVSQSPLEAHRPLRVRLHGLRDARVGSGVGIGLRWLLHDVVDPAVGYPPLSTVEVARLDLAVTAHDHVLLDEATAIRIEQIAPVSSFQSALAWKVELGARRLGYRSEMPLHIGAEFGIGLGAALRSQRYVVAPYSMLGIRQGAALTNVGTSFAPVGMWSGGLLLQLPMDIRARLWGEYSISLRSREEHGFRWGATVRKGLTRDWDLELSGDRSWLDSRIALGFATFR